MLTVASGSDIGAPVCSAADHWQDPHRSVNKSGSVSLCCQGVVFCCFYSGYEQWGRTDAIRPTPLMSRLSGRDIT
ncbi:hypothetical protein CP880_01390 [Cutibacterium namnetense]|uniref:Uncharacterized protein n=1 Tax=Cutibacterium namnetense TaxID=1574624 RepID=A0ABX9IBV0_9ACTN|nr:hypothetical protein CP880_01390 [Cutibacterium namnetense]TKW72766.1 MAG: hypothetical protein DI580_02480 [Cutibacterium acnes]